MSDEFTLREVDISQDAGKLVEMWKASDEQYPGTMSGGAPITEEWVTESYEREKKIAAYVFEIGRKIVGYCAFGEREGEENTGYVGPLNVQPDYQGRSLGRRLLVHTLERCVDLGFHVLSLDTWAGNLKSVPLYKKTGFFWIPGTSVWMLNFIPAILSLPCARPFFQRHDWYRTFVRELEQAEDDERWEGIKVCTYRWEEDGEALTVWADREAWTLTAVETDAFFAAAIADDIAPAKGQSTYVRWRIANKQECAMSILLITSGTEHIVVDHRATLTVAPGETAEIKATVDIAADAPDVRGNNPVPAVHTLLILDGEVLELGTGLRPQTTITVGTSPRYVTLFPGVPKTVHLQLRSYLQEDVEATVSLAPVPGLTTDWTERKVLVPSKSYAALPVTLQATGEDVYPLRATVYCEGGKAPSERFAIFGLDAGGVLADKGERETRIENEWTRLILGHRGGRMSISASRYGVRLGGFRERVGPPFRPSELDNREYTLSLQEVNKRIRAVLTADMETYPGLTVRQEVMMGAGPVIELGHALGNNGTEPYQPQVFRRVRISLGEEATITVPLQDGIVQGRLSEFPAMAEVVGKDPEAFAARWAAVHSRWGTLGILWDEDIAETEFDAWGATLLSSQLTCGPQQWTPAGKCYLYAGPGDWRAVREHARRLAGTDLVPEPVPVDTRRVYDARLEPAPLVTVDDRVTAKLVVDNLRARPLEGEARLALPKELTADRETFEIERVSRKEPLSQEVTIALPPAATAYEGDVLLHTRLFDTHLRIPVIRLGDRREVSVAQGESEGQSTWAIDNGHTRFVVAPGFGGALIRWEENGVNHVLSPFPEQGIFGWMGPWYGGLTPLAISPIARDYPGQLGRAAFAAQVVDSPDTRGIPWRGVRLGCELTQEDLVGLRVELEYLTLGRSNVLKLVYRLHNTTTARRQVNVGWLSFCQPDGASESNVLRSNEIERKRTPWASQPAAGHWGMVTNPETGRTAILISPMLGAALLDWGDVSGHLACDLELDVMPLATTERVCYLALCSDVAEARRYTWLKEYT